jgi:D-alanyl-D-alanine carboxypeptidase
MTAYVTLRAVKEGRLKLDTLLAVSANAVAQAPTKMGFKAGTTVTVDNALKMLMVKSANDVAVVLAEGVSGSIANFAEDMNKAARRLGMTQTTYVNPNGLPADAQITSARDQAILARAILRELPEYELYWRISAIQFGKRVMRNYNTLIDRYPGADGMKTGFICASGFNLVASATRNGKRLIAVVLGAPSGPVRAVKAAQLLERGFNNAVLSWLTPSLGSVETLQPISAEPPNLRDDMCGKRRKRPAAESEDHEEPVEAQNVPGLDSNSPQAFLLSQLRAPNAKPSALIGDLTPSMAPIVVFTGASKDKGKPSDTQVASGKSKSDGKKATSDGKKSKKGVTVAAPAGANVPIPAATAKGQTQGPTQVNGVNVTAPAFAASPPLYPSTTSFTPPPAANAPAAAPKPRPAAVTTTQPAKPAQTATKPAQAAAKPAAKPASEASAAPKKPAAQ